MEEELTKEQLKKGIETYQELFLWENDKADIYERKCKRLKEEIKLLRDITENYRELLKDKEWQDASGKDTLEHLDDQTKEEYEHYKNL